MSIKFGMLQEWDLTAQMIWSYCAVVHIRGNRHTVVAPFHRGSNFTKANWQGFSDVLGKQVENLEIFHTNYGVNLQN